jgi:hypothetical protein
MQLNRLLAPLTVLALAVLAATPSFAADTPHLTGLVRLVKTDGTTVLAQAAPSIVVGTSAPKIPEITVSDKDAFISVLGRCAFNLKYDEVSTAAASNTTNRIYANDTLIAQNTAISLTAGAVKTIWTQPYLKPGANNVKLVINAESATPNIGWVRVNVTGNCGAVQAPPPAASAPAPAPTPAPVLIQPGSADWNALNTAWGYSNYAVTQLKGKGFAGYDTVVKLNARLSAAVAAKSITKPAYAELMTAWNALLANPAFKAAMAAITPPTGKV